MDILITIIISGMATSYLIELLSSLLERVASPRLIKMIFTVPLSFGTCWLLGLLGPQLIVGTLATGFFSLVLLRWVNRPVTIQTLNNRR